MRFRLVALLALLPLAAHAQAVDDGVSLIQNVPGREPVSLDGTWGVVVDPFETGYYSHRYTELPFEASFFADQKPADPSDRVEYDYDGGVTLEVPGDWNTQDERLFLYEGTVWYKRAFDYVPTPGARVFLHFGAVNYDARVALNGTLLGGHVGGFTPFQFEVTDQVREGENVLTMKVDNQRHRDAVPTVNSDWWNYGGVTRSVSLVEVPETFVEDYFVQLAPGSLDGDRAEVAGWVRLDGPAAASGRAEVSIPDLGVDVEAEADADGVAHFRVPVEGLVPWSPAHPRLYDVTVRGGGDAVSDRIGLRTIERRGEDLLLNGEPVFLRGISLHEEKPTGDGRATSREDAERLLGWVRELNGNFVRLAHYPHNEAMVRTAEEMGLLVWSEIPVYWTVQFENPETYANAERQLREMVSRDKNRAGVVLWSVANETPRSDDRLSFLTRLVETTRRLDPTRLVAAALDTQDREGDTTHIRDPLGAVVDVIGVNTYCGWYGGTPESCAAVRWASDFGKPVVISEMGGGALAGRHGPADERWTEEYQAAVYRNNLAMADHIPFLRGISPWILKDFRSPRRPLPGVQDFWNRKGLVSEAGEKKQAFSILQEYYRHRAALQPDP